MAKRETKKSGGRLKIFGAGALVGLLVVGFALYWVFFRDSAPASVDSVEAAEARAEAIAEAAADGDINESDTAVPETAPVVPEGQSDDDASASDTEVDVGQPDSAASVGSASDGVWTVDTSIGSFDASCLTEACGASFAGFRINEELASFGAKTVVGRTGNVSGSLELQGSQIVGASFVVDMTTLITDDDGRTSALRGTSGGLETNDFPEAIFVLTQAIELGEVPAEGVSVDVQAVGDLTVHGVTRQVTIPLTAELQAGVISVFGNLEAMLLSDYNIPKPTAIVVVSVEDNATMEVQLFFRQ